MNAIPPLTFLLLLFVFGTLPVLATEPRGVLHTLDYLSVDYPGAVVDGRVANELEYAEQVEFSTKLVGDLQALPENPGKERLLERALELQRLIQDKAPGAEVSHLARHLAQAVAETYQVTLAPRRPPVLAQTPALYDIHCAQCHGSNGRGDGPEAADLDPPPIDFHDRERAFQRSLYGLYSAITRGVDGTAMRPFDELDDEQRWALAFYVGAKAFSQEERERGMALWEEDVLHWDLATLTALTPAEAEERWGMDGVALMAYLRAHPEALADTGSVLGRARALLAQSLEAARTGDWESAYQNAVAAYLEGFELVEPILRTTQAERVAEIENLMLLYRQKVREEAPVDELADMVQRIDTLLDQAETYGERNRLTKTATFIGSLVIILREGLEAVLVLAAIAGVLIQGGRRDALPYLHAGWIGALAAGVLTWVAANHLITLTGAGRELTEGITALAAAVVLLYVGFWLHDKTHTDRWREYVRERIQKTLHGGALWILTGIAFLAVYREAFETVLFYQALWMQADDSARNMLWTGMGTGTIILLALIFAILRLGRRLPLRQFFSINAAILLVLAVSFIGHGVAALQEAGWLEIHSLPLPRWDLVGLYPTMETIGAQLLTIALIAWVYWRHNRRSG